MLVRSCALQVDKQSCFDNCLVTVLLSCVNMFHSAFRDKHHTCAIHSLYNMAIFSKVYWPKVLPLSIFCFPFEFVGFVIVFFYYIPKLLYIFFACEWYLLTISVKSLIILSYQWSISFSIFWVLFLWASIHIFRSFQRTYVNVFSWLNFV